MVLSLILDGEYYSFVILPFVGSHRRFLHNFEYFQTFVANSIIVVPLEISYQLWHDLQLGCREAPAVKESLENFILLSPFIFLFFVGAYYPPI